MGKKFEIPHILTTDFKNIYVYLNFLHITAENTKIIVN